MKPDRHCTYLNKIIGVAKPLVDTNKSEVKVAAVAESKTNGDIKMTKATEPKLKNGDDVEMKKKKVEPKPKALDTQAKKTTDLDKFAYKPDVAEKKSTGIMSFV